MKEKKPPITWLQNSRYVGFINGKLTYGRGHLKKFTADGRLYETRYHQKYIEIVR